MWNRVTALGLMLVVGLSGCASGSAGPDPTEAAAATSKAATPQVADYVPLLVESGRLTSAAICAKYTTLLAQWDKQAGTFAKLGNRAAGDPYKAEYFRQHNAWVDAGYGSRFDNAVQASALAALNAVTDGRAGTATSLATYTRDSIAACGLTAKYEATITKVASVDSAASRVTSAAANMPWYPKGYFEVTDGLAGKWINGAGNDCYECTYATLDVVAESGCPSGVYVEVGLEKNGAAIDWTNDSLSALRMGQRGRLSFEFYSASASHGQVTITEARCY